MKEILKEKSAATFYRMVMAQVQKYDENFSKLSLYFQKTGTGDRLKIDKPHFACCVDALPNRKSDYDESVTWTHEGKTYCLYLEFTPKDLETAFIPKFNVAYANVFSIEKNAGEYILTSLQENADETIDRKNSSDGIKFNACLEQKIFFGAPGTGKSFKVNEAVQNQQVFRTTFHPDYDYAQFVGAYKPKKDGNAITYSFVPQVFAKAYAAVWKLYLQRDSRDSIGASPLQNDSGKDIQVYLVIEEINRGNCAQIFGDIFQLLDRDSAGFSQYAIDADCDFADWLKEDSVLKTVWSDYETKVGDGKLKLPPNLNILATMNTSDQSLFPMDSAFKRRFDWEYVPINYEKSEADFIVGDASFNFKWLDFLKKVNADIYKVTQSEDKQMGEFFIKPKNKDYVTLDEFRSKVLFYLWDSVYKDELDSKLVFHFAYPEKGPDVTFQRLFNSDFVEILKQMLANLDDKYKDGAQQG